jgi:hypothetical protein
MPAVTGVHQAIHQSIPVVDPFHDHPREFVTVKSQCREDCAGLGWRRCDSNRSSGSLTTTKPLFECMSIPLNFISTSSVLQSDIF